MPDEVDAAARAVVTALASEDIGAEAVHWAERTNGDALRFGDEDAEVVWRSVRSYIKAGNMGEAAQAAHVLDLLPAMPKPVTGSPGADGSYGTGLNKMGFRDMASQAVRLAHGEEGLFANFVETMIETNASGFEVRLARNTTKPDGTPTDKKGPDQVSIFDTFNRVVNADPVTWASVPNKQRGIEAFQDKFIWQWWTTGLVVMLYNWDYVPVPELRYKKYNMPIDLTILDPLRVDLDDYAMKGLVYHEYEGKVKKDLLAEINKIGLDNHPYFKLFDKETSIDRTNPRRMYEPSREQAFTLLKGKNKLPLPFGHFKVERRVFNDNEVYPVPFAVRLYAAVNDKRMLRNMDRSVIRKIIMMILRITIKQQEKGRPRALHLEKTVAALEAQLTLDPEYVQVCALPEGADLGWVTPDSRWLLDTTKYRTVNFEILAAMVGLVASQILDGGGQVDLSLIGEQLWRKNNLCVQRFKSVLQELYDQIIVTNRLQKIRPGAVKIVLKQFSLYATDAFKTFVGNLVARGLLPVKMAVDHIGEDFETVVENLIEQVGLMENYGIFSAPPTNTQTYKEDVPHAPGEPLPPKEVSKQGPNMGRPPGKQEAKKRERDNTNEDDNPPPSQM